MIGPKDQVRIALEVDMSTQVKLAISKFFAEQTDEFNRWVDDEVKRFDFESAVRAYVRSEIAREASLEAQRRVNRMRDKIEKALKAEMSE